MLSIRILHLEDDSQDVELVRAACEGAGICANWTRVDNRDAFLSALKQETFDLILSDYQLPSFNGLAALDIAREKNSDVPFIFVSGTIGEELAIETIKKGATDYVLKNRLSRLPSVIQRALRESFLNAQVLRTQRMENLGALAGGIAHDLNNVLAPILMAVQLLKRKAGEEDQRVLSIVHGSAQRGADMVKQILTFARGVEGKRGAIQLSHLINEMVGIANETFPKSIEIRIKLEKELWTVSGDATQFHQILLNLCVNARDAMPKGGTLEISTENVVLDEAYARMNPQAKAGPYVLLTVADNGSGIPEEHLEKIFEPFFTTKEIGRGTGLGLSTVLTIVHNHDGFIDVESQVGQGTKFHVYLPAITSGEAQTDSETDPGPLGHGELVLVVDDEASIRDITKASLETYGYKVIVASDGSEAVALAAQNSGKISAVVLDMMMPVMDGEATIRVLQKLNPDMRIIAVSGLKNEGKVPQISGALMPTFLSKPYTAAKLLKTIHQVLASGRRGSENG